MPRKLWIFQSLNEKQRSSNDLCSFLYSLYTALEDHIALRGIKLPVDEVKTKSLGYKQSVLKILEDKKSGFPLSDKDLRDMQMEIEDLTMKFNEGSIYKQAPNLIKILIQTDRLSAKDYLLDKLANDEKDMLEEFGQYTLEALIIHVLGILFSTHETETMVRASSLIDQLDSCVRTHSKLLGSRYQKKKMENVHMSETKKNLYSIGVHLLEFMIERGLVSSITVESFSGVVKKKSKGGYFTPSNLFIVCEFDISLLPIKLNLPMICPPLDWKSACPDDQSPRYLSDLSGGYLSGPTGEIYDRYRLLSSGNLNHFYIYIGNDDNYKYLCNVMNSLQRQPFTINSDWLDYLIQFEDSFVDNGLLMPKFLEELDIREVYPLLREYHMKHEIINKEFSFNDLLNSVIKNIQRSRYERLILNLASAYNGYKFYLPAFLDFRGRIYRSGILHFHERDLARSLIVFADHNETRLLCPEKANAIACLATSFHYNSFNTIRNAADYFNFLDENRKTLGTHENLTSFPTGAKRPFQFCANMFALVHEKYDYLKDYVPITQDAASSAYQIMSYFLLDETLAERTNLFPSLYGEINDVYLFFLEELKEFMKAELEDNLCSVVCKHLNRKIVKSIFMPILYGKTLMSTSTDLMGHFSQHLTRKECFLVGKVCFKFFKEKYPGMECLIRLISLIGWVASARGSAVTYNVSYFTTVQDYHKMEPILIWVYDRLHKKKRRVTLRVSSDKRDRRKTETSTFVNFIHQKDAFIAMKVVEEMLEFSPIYTVHDNFITTANSSNLIPMTYLKVFRSLGPPLSIINKFIYMNVIHHLRCRSFDYENHVISKKYLTEFLNQNIPEKISKLDKIIWDSKINEIVTCYGEYVNKVCGVGHSSYNNSWKSHVEMWNKFSSKLEYREGCSFCVHY